VKDDPCRFCRLYALALVPIAALLGAMMTWQTSLLLPGSARSGQGYMLVSLLHSVAPASSGSALMIALVLWVHPLTSPATERELLRILKRAALVSIPGFVVAALVSWLVSRALGPSLLDIPAPAFSAQALRAWNVGFGALATLADAALVLFAAWRFLPRVQAMRLSLPGKLALSWTVLFPLRAFVGLVLQENLPG
jgi:hypothetical protein